MSGQLAGAVEALEAVREALSAAKLPGIRAELNKVAKTPKVLAGRDAEVGMSLMETLEHDTIANRA